MADRLPLVVDPEWVEAHRVDPNLRIVDATTHLTFPEDGNGYYRLNGGRETYAAEHLPGAVFADLLTDFADPGAEHAFTVPSSERFAAAAGELGIGDDSLVVVYDQHDGYWATRFWWQLRLEGFDNVTVLEGGLRRWKAEERPVDDAPASYPTATFTARRRPELLAKRDEIEAALGDDDTILINVLDEDTFTGARQTYARPGRIPGSVNVFVGDLIDPSTGGLRPVDELRPLFERVGALDPSRRVVTYCGSGIAATMDALALSALGRDDVAIYDGSMTEWAADPALPIEQG